MLSDPPALESLEPTSSSGVENFGSANQNADRPLEIVCLLQGVVAAWRFQFSHPICKQFFLRLLLLLFRQHQFSHSQLIGCKEDERTTSITIICRKIFSSWPKSENENTCSSSTSTRTSSWQIKGGNGTRVRLAKKFHYLIIAILIGFHFLSERSKLSNFKFISDFQINFCIRWWRQWLLCCCCVAPLLAVRLLRLFCFAVTYLLGTTECNNHHQVASSTFAK